MQSGLFTTVTGKYCTAADLASIASTCKAAFPALFLLTARDRRAFLLSQVLSLLANHWTWRLHPTRITHIRFLIIDVDQNLLPRGLNGVQKAWVRVDSSCNLPLPPNLRWLKYEYSFTFCDDTDARHQRCCMWWKIHDHSVVDTCSRNASSASSITGLHTLDRLEVLYFKRLVVRELKRDMLPSTIKGLFLEDGSFPIQMGALPPMLEELDLGQSYLHPLLPGTIPQSVLGLVVLSEHQRFIDNLDVAVEAGVVPAGLKFLGLRYEDPRLQRDMKVLRPLTEVATRGTWSYRKYKPRYK